eukprot:CAMPEP_0194265806 /NCGR_PEP_ID=MMETSP0169-20130528/922_1 /TAXON_ID=218684 /ORGANISM="Corethron pennatum, Strain L29A3" /LENGTH=559 /DNA_ID=CAMNT_0039006353 /DNA_START=156 /DNA_END=1835 /DNA_ORIENTATION=-
MASRSCMTRTDDSTVTTTTDTVTRVSPDGTVTTTVTTTIVSVPRPKIPAVVENSLPKFSPSPSKVLARPPSPEDLAEMMKSSVKIPKVMDLRPAPKRSQSQTLRLRRAQSSPANSKPGSVRMLSCAYQKYAWGKSGGGSTAANMVMAASREHEKAGLSSSFTIPDNVPVAEMWMGTHPSGMSRVLDKDGVSTSLLDYVRQDPDKHTGEGENNLTFLFKVLSIGQVLSIQAHPDKHLAVRLHAARPTLYKDPNHKPEMAISLSDDTSALIGFRPIPEIYEHMINYPEFAQAVGDRAVAMCASLAGFRSGYGASVGGDEMDRPVEEGRCWAALQEMFRTFVCSDRNEHVVKQVHAITKRLREKNKTDGGTDVTEGVILYFASIYPDDPCVLSPLFFNHVQIARGQALYIRTNEPHAYISGELIECMACSDNVVRVGLTPKVKDTETLLDMLTYRAGKPRLTYGERIDGHTTLYRPPVKDFCVETVIVEVNGKSVIAAVPSPAILLCVEGGGSLNQEFADGTKQELKLSFGMSVFISANTSVEVATDGGIMIARAMSNVYCS